MEEQSIIRQAGGEAPAVGAEPIYSGVWTVSQTQIDAFADATEDHQYIHTDPTRAADSPFGGTIAHGFLLLSMLSAMYSDAIPLPSGHKMSINAGFDRVRFVRPCLAGSQIRARFDLAEQTSPADDQIAQVWNVRLELADTAEPPLLTAIWRLRHIIDPNHTAKEPS